MSDLETAINNLGSATDAMNDLTAAVNVKKATLDTSVTDAEAARDAAQSARDTTLAYRDASVTSSSASAQSATVATAAAQALIGTEGIIPTASEIVWLASKPQAGVNALGFFDTGARLLSGVSERALLRYGEDNETLNFALGFPALDGFRLDFTQDDAVFSDTAGTTPADPGDSLARVNDQSGNGIDSTQPNAALRGKWGKAPKDVRNLVVRSEKLDQSPWAVIDATITATAGAWKVAADSATNGRLEQVYSVSNNSLTETFSIYAKADGAWYVNIGRAGAGSWFDLQEGTVLFNADGFTGTISIADADGYRRVSVEHTESILSNGTNTQFRIYLSVNAPTTSNPMTGSGNDGIKGILIKKPQRERGALSDYQAVGASNLDVTEIGVQSFGFYRPDLSDDVLPLTVPAIDGDILIAGKDGIHIAAITASAGAFSIGPTTYTGGDAGVLAAVGDIVGIELIDKTLSASETERLIRYYQSRGAGSVI